jgi:hypothetical protein
LEKENDELKTENTTLKMLYEKEKQLLGSKWGTFGKSLTDINSYLAQLKHLEHYKSETSNLKELNRKLELSVIAEKGCSESLLLEQKQNYEKKLADIEAEYKCNMEALKFKAELKETEYNINLDQLETRYDKVSWEHSIKMTEMKNNYEELIRKVKDEKTDLRNEMQILQDTIVNLNGRIQQLQECSGIKYTIH